MNYQSIADLSIVVKNNLHKIPCDVDLVVGVPRSGVLPASMIALQLNVHYCDLNTLIKNDVLQRGQTRKIRHSEIIRPSDAQHILILDDSVATGDSMNRVVKVINELELNSKITYSAIYSTKQGQQHVDLYLAELSVPRVFEWHLMHRPILNNSCVDIDGVICWDPTDAENDDGPAYRNFLLNARPLILPSQRIGHLVSSRLEKYRKETETWLRQHGVQYEQLHLLNLPDAATRQSLRNHGDYKADIYKKLKNTVLFIESEPHQAIKIAQLSGKPVLCFGNQIMYQPGLTYANLQQRQRTLTQKVWKKLLRIMSGLVRHG